MCGVQCCATRAGEEADVRRAGLCRREAHCPHLPCCRLPLQVGFVMRLEGGRLAAHLEEQLPDYAFAFQGGSEGAAGEVGEWVGGWVRGWVGEWAGSRC